MKFMLIVCAAFLARQKPVSTIAKPACMNMTRKPADQRPHEVDGDLVVADRVHDFGQRRGGRVLHRDVLGRPGRGPGRIPRRCRSLRADRLRADHRHQRQRHHNRECHPAEKTSASTHSLLSPCGPVPDARTWNRPSAANAARRSKSNATAARAAERSNKPFRLNGLDARARRFRETGSKAAEATKCRTTGAKATRMSGSGDCPRARPG